MASGSEARVSIKIGSRPTLTDEAAKSTMGADGNGDLVREIIQVYEDGDCYSEHIADVWETVVNVTISAIL